MMDIFPCKAQFKNPLDQAAETSYFIIKQIL